MTMTPQEVLQTLVGYYSAGQEVPVATFNNKSYRDVCEYLTTSNLSFNNLCLTCTRTERPERVDVTYHMKYVTGRKVLTELADPERIF